MLFAVIFWGEKKAIQSAKIHIEWLSRSPLVIAHLCFKSSSSLIQQLTNTATH